MKKIISLFLVLLIAFGLTACKKNKTNNNVNSEDNKYTVTLADFETYEDVYNMQDVISNFTYEGYKTQSSKEKAISGNGSLEWHITGSLGDTWATYARDGGYAPMIYLSLWYNTKNEGNWGFNFDQVESIEADVFNDNDFDIHMSMFYMTKTYHPIGYYSETISAGQTKTLTFSNSRYFMQNELTRTIGYVAFVCNYDYVVNEEGQLYYPTANVYMDNIKANVNKNSVFKADGSIDINKTFDGNEILNFSDPRDLDYLYSFGSNYVKEQDNEWGTYTWFYGIGSSLKYNTNPNYVKGENLGSLKWTVEFPYINTWSQSNYQFFASKNYTYSTTWTGFTLCHDFLSYYNFAKVINGKAKIAVDVYNAGSYDKEVAFGMHDKEKIGQNEMKEYPYSYNELAPTDKWYKLPAGEWTTLEITDFSMVDFSKGLGRLRLVTSFIDVFEPIDFYVNNLRIVEI